MKSILLIIHLISFCTFGQLLSNENAWISGNLGGGLVIPEYSNITYSVNRPIIHFNVALLKRSVGKHFYEQLYRYPEYGINLGFTSLGNPSVFGQEFNLYPFLRTFFVRKKKTAIFHQFGFGIGIATKKFDLLNNPDNISVGSHVNMHFDYQIGVRYSLNKHWGIEPSIRFSHFSNANMAEPNLGLNLLTANLSLLKSIGNQSELIKQEIPSNIKKIEFSLIYAAGGKHTRALQSKIYFTSSFSAAISYHAFHKFHFGLGMDLFFDSSTKTELSINPNQSYQPGDEFSSGIHASQEIVFNTFSFILQEGLHVGLIDPVHKSRMYNRAIIRWKCGQKLMIQFSMKSHLHILDYPEFGIGYYFTTKK